MKLLDMLKIEGNNQYQVLTYLVFQLSGFAHAQRLFTQIFDGDKYNVTPLIDEGWPFGIILVEGFLNDKTLISKTILEIMLKGTDFEGLLALCCMVDGVFYSYDDVFSLKLPEQVYGVYTKEFGIDVLLDDEARNSPKWKEVIEKHRRVINL